MDDPMLICRWSAWGHSRRLDRGPTTSDPPHSITGHSHRPPAWLKVPIAGELKRSLPNECPRK